MVFGNLGNMAEMMKQAREMQKNLKNVKEELKRSRYENDSDGVKVIANGEMEILEMKINPGMEPRKLDEAVKKSVNRVLKTAKDDAANKLKSLTGGLSIPGLT
ncbi:nucleoid-associated protein, YbaB/EbfC family [candidate division WOR-1 bacterium RIFOXYC2_FULL_37_10]|uniref:Nucleoid-associated protein, YbaB/EbfC family n=1 Tax=candidate division WOR-1 bacterium RIFOXYB2_FULL_37_13 TaxID=1802579 RepID=A0A1F4SDU0_UNCSA|nr:MAG: nucleoid-associated protein, YbaB/EbfC family [candidate division WOR-1 bacterium RIFOXYA2_FULL_37_7]OGC18605.1 MAG: nucleoid-associated protein, YbaB/EbfC family [candidate division WOR-1 bacterium RIFOXYB2_FULL_37_13]OGC36819.1 MAG: nucleoid-associated protein, YbaB/EbfC family [candidate division WOR-1 bacterium RIFOXYC2_FULL_37_10]